MLPGFRFLFAAIVFSMSLLIFGLGAAALLRSAHEEFAANPSWRATPEVTFAQGGETAPPVLAALRVEPAAAEKAQDEASIAAASEDVASAPAPADVSEQIAAAKPEETLANEPTKPETARSELSADENVAASEIAQTSTETPKAAVQIQLAAIIAPATTPTPVNQAPVAAESDPIAAKLASIDANAAAKIATLGGPPVEIEEVSPKATAAAKPGDPAAAKKRAEARRAAARRRIAAARARQAGQQQTQQQQLGPFFQQQAQGTATR